MPRASKQTKKDKKKQIEIRYEPNIKDVEVSLNKKGDFILIISRINRAYMAIRTKDLSAFIDDLTRIEKALHYEKVINNAVHK